MCYMQLAWNATKGQRKIYFEIYSPWGTMIFPPVWWDKFSRSLEDITIVTYHTNLPLFLGSRWILRGEGFRYLGVTCPGPWCRRCNKMLGVYEHYWFQLVISGAIPKKQFFLSLGDVPTLCTNLRVLLRNFRVGWQCFWTVIPGMEFSFRSNFRIKPCHISLHLGCCYSPEN